MTQWHHLQIVDGRHFVDGVLSTKVRYGRVVLRAKEIHPAVLGGDWALVIGLDTPAGQAALAREIKILEAEIRAGQEPLGADFEAVWDANVDKLHES